MANASSGWLSKGAPQEAPALARSMSTRGVCFLTSATRCSMPAGLEESAGTEMACAPGARLGRALRAWTAESQASALREVMKTFEAPAWRRLVVVSYGNGHGGREAGEGKAYAEAAWRPRPREPPVTTATLPFSEKSEGKSLSSTSAIVSDEAV